MARFKTLYLSDGSTQDVKVVPCKIDFGGNELDRYKGYLSIGATGRFVDEQHEPIVIGENFVYTPLPDMLGVKIEDYAGKTYPTRDGQMSMEAVAEWLSQFFDEYLVEID